MSKTKDEFRFHAKSLLIVLVIAAIIILISYKNNNNPMSEAEQIADIVLDDHPLSIASNGVVEENKLKKIEKMDYTDLKKSMKVKNDFCMYIKDSDGNIILTKGSERLMEDGLYCNE